MFINLKLGKLTKIRTNSLSRKRAGFFKQFRFSTVFLQCSLLVVSR